ncbi:hypothetical protein GYMLUDRAFT_976369 [Collybiopsis luxurians FD-317 M1]|nr:hypothetical protein GYMLUDRAFT_976369 [Collybiopsis luxurians FD-317 M1]
MLLAFLLSFSLQVAAAASNTGSRFALAQQSLVFAPGWQSATTAASGNFRFTDNLGQALTVTLPSSTSSLNYVGLKRTGGSIYGVCVDCPSGTTTNLELFSGHDNTLLDNADAEPATIFSLNVDPAQEHTLQIVNVADNSLGGESELTFISIVIIQQSSSTTTSSTTTSTSSALSTSSSVSVSTTTSVSTPVSSSASTASSSTMISASATPSATASSAPDLRSSSTQTRTSLIAIITILSLVAVLSLVIGFFFYFRKQRQGGTSLVNLTGIEDPPATKQGIPSPRPGGLLAMAGRQKPPPRLPEPYPYQLSVPRDGPILPVRRLESG